MGSHQTYHLLHSKGNHKQNKTTTYRMGENICKQCNRQGLISKIYKQLTQLNSNNNNKCKQKIEQLNIYPFFRGTSQPRNQTGVSCISGRFFSSLATREVPAIREMQIKITMRYHLTLVQMTIIKKSTNNKCWGECGVKGMLLHS